MLKIKRVYDGESTTDGKRILVDRLRPRGIKKEEILLWIRFNVPQKFDLEWFKTMGGMIRPWATATCGKGQRGREGMVLARIPFRNRRGGNRYLNQSKNEFQLKTYSRQK